MRSIYGVPTTHDLQFIKKTSEPRHNYGKSVYLFLNILMPTG